MKSFITLAVLLTLVSCGRRTRNAEILVNAPKADTRASCQVFEVIGSSQLPDFSTLSSLGEIKVSELDSPKTNVTQSFNTLVGTPHESLVEQFGLNCTGEFVANVSGNHIFYLNSDDGSSLSINDFPMISSNNGLHSMQKKSTTIFLVKDQVYKINIKYFQNFGEKGLILSVKKPNVSLEEVVKF